MRVIDALWDAGWGRGADLGSEAEIAGIVDAAGVDGGALVARTTEQAAKDALRASTERAIGFGVFGVPSMVVEDELFWGNDQVEHIESFLAGTDPLASLDLSAVAPTGHGIRRRR